MPEYGGKYMDMNAKWLSIWNDNYYGRSDFAKELEAVLKKNYKGHKYVPWAVMVRMLYNLDPDAKLDVISPDETSGTSRYVHTDERVLWVKKDGKETQVTVMSHFVTVSCTFLGKVFTEVYPIQDNAYNAPKDFDSNMVNKAIQRAKAKVISLATGLGFSLYESGDLQFEDDGDVKDVPHKNVVPKTAPKKDAVKSKPTEDVSKDDLKDTPPVNDDIVALAKFIINEKPNAILNKINPSFEKTYGTTLSTEDSLPILIGKISRVSKPDLFVKSFYNMMASERSK